MTDPRNVDGPSDERLEQLMREGLAARAQQGPEREPARRVRRWPAILAAAAAVVLVGALVPFALSQRDDGPVPPSADPTTSPDPSQDSSEAADPTEGWRVESWHDISVRVPSDWGWGGGPTSGEWTEGNLTDCGAAPFVVPGDDAYEFVPKSSPYVGRPLLMTDACFNTVGELPTRVRGDFVLLGSPYRFGVHRLDRGFTAETVEAGELNVTVVTRDPGLRKQILSTVEVGARDPHGCAAIELGPRPSGPDTAPESIDRMRVCVYGAGELVWSQVVDAAAAQGYLDAIGRAPKYSGPDSCRPTHQVLLTIDGTDASGKKEAWTDRVDTDCGRVATGSDERRLTKQVARHWTGGGTQAYVLAPAGSGEWPGMFRPMLG